MKRIMGTWVGLFSIAILCVTLTLVVVWWMSTETLIVDGDSMNPTLEDNEKIRWKPMTFTNGEADYGDIVVVVDEEEVHGIIVKRIFGKPKDKIEFRNNVMYRNNVKHPEIVLPENYEFKDSVKEPVIVPEGEVYLLGDNIPDSVDSRVKGTFDASQLLGKVIFK